MHFVSADSIVPEKGAAQKQLTVDFHEPGFNAKLASENAYGPWFTLSDKEKQQLGSPMGPQNPQTLNRYSYVGNNPMGRSDPSGHFGVTFQSNGTMTIHVTHAEIKALNENLSGDTAFWTTGVGLTILAGFAKTKQFAGFAGGMVTLATAVTKILAADDELFGNNGLDITFKGYDTISSIAPPTINRQEGIHLDPPLLDGVSIFVHTEDGTVHIKGENAQVCQLPQAHCHTR